MKTAWDKYLETKDVKKVMDFSEGYKDYLGASKTEREAATEAIKLAKKANFKDFKNVKEVKPGDKIYFNNRGKSVAFFVIGKTPIEKGLNILGAHIDSPRCDITPKPLRSKANAVINLMGTLGGIIVLVLGMGFLFDKI